MKGPLAGKVALVAGGTRAAGRGIAVEVGAAGATVYVTGRTTRRQRSEMNRPETIEETAEMVEAAGGKGIPVRVDHLVPGEVRDLVGRIDREQGALHVLVNDIWGATTMEWNKTVWESSLDVGLRYLRLGVETHAITSHFALPLLIKSAGGLVVEVGDGTEECNATRFPAAAGQGLRLHRPRRQPTRRLGLHHRSPRGRQGRRRQRLPLTVFARFVPLRLRIAVSGRARRGRARRLR